MTANKRKLPMTVKKSLETPVRRYHALKGDSFDYCETGKAKCANKMCTAEKQKMTLIAAVYQYGMFDDHCTEIWACKVCLENTCFKYETKVELVKHEE